ncbi:acyltransferase family protein [Knoellia subterranea]|uniref:Lipopolysaccharide modification acyltransferase n=1 Tax=Knoellia subterranea KCTC 19937 TaxID=1385521 RepID=A0A0A0JHX2_9MICO|nr:acyltransferase family protein [Knoellia subterranea]KGN36723.1 lipopolysaccharide modification acyltransferase [Knoellia subterranea KCTC 19937]
MTVESSGSGHGVTTTSTPSRGVAAHPDGRLPGLDGLRAIAILAVLAFHLDPRWLPGGFLGVDVFFVISGFLITTLLVRERASEGRIDLRGFWTRRARRLLPALLVLVPSVILLARLVETDLLVGIGRQAIGALTFTSNWLEIGAGSDYFHSTSPQLLMNLWSLAVEEQFYLVWPLVAIGLMFFVRSSRARAGIAVALALGSAVLMASRYDPELGATRVYYGTDTHLMGLMLGAALAFAWAAPHRAWTSTDLWQRLRVPVVAGAAIVLAALVALLDESTPLTFRGGILLASLATTVLVLGVVERPSPLRSALDLPVLRWIGERSYGLYLWHWPVILIVEADLSWASRGADDYVWSRLWCVVVTAAIADLSYRFIETPVRRRGFRGTGRHILHVIRWSGTRTARAVWASVAVLAIALTAVMVTAPSRTRVQELLDANAAAATATIPTAAPSTPTPTGASATKGATPPATSTQPATTGGKPATGGQSWAMPTGAEIDAYGDSMMVGSLHALRYYFPGIRIDARSNRQWSEGLKVVQARGNGNRRAVVLALGTNAGTDLDRARQVLDALGPQRMVVIVTLHGRINRIASDNAKLRELVAGRDNVALADWDAALVDTTGQLQSDGMHPSLKGAHLYSKTIRQAFADLSERHTGTKVTLKELPLP